MNYINDNVLVKVHALREGYKDQLRLYAEQLKQFSSGMSADGYENIKPVFQLLHTITGSSGTFELAGVEDAARAACNFVRYLVDGSGLSEVKIQLVKHYVDFLCEEIGCLQAESFDDYRKGSRELVRRKLFLLSQADKDLLLLSKDISRSGYELELLSDNFELERNIRSDAGLLVREEYLEKGGVDLNDLSRKYGFVFILGNGPSESEVSNYLSMEPRDELMLKLDLASHRIPYTEFA